MNARRTDCGRCPNAAVRSPSPARSEAATRGSISKAATTAGAADQPAFGRDLVGHTVSVDTVQSAPLSRWARAAAMCALLLAWLTGAALAWSLLGHSLDQPGVLPEDVIYPYGPYSAGRLTPPLIAVAGIGLVLCLLVVLRSPLRWAGFVGVVVLGVLGAMCGYGWRMLTARTDGNNIAAGLFLLVEPVLLVASVLAIVGMSVWILGTPRQEQLAR